MRWADPLYLQLLPGVLLLIVVVWLSRKFAKRRALELADEKLWPRVARASTSGRRFARTAFLLLAISACLLGAARPQLGARTVQVRRSGIDLVMALDTSVSMDAADVVPSRLGRARREMIDLMEKLKGDRVGIVVFEGTAFLLCPLTLDQGAARLFLDSVESGMLPVPGSNLAEAVRTGVKAFPDEGNRSRALVIFSDGEAVDPELDSAIKEAGDAGVKIYCIGVGTPAGEPIPVRDDMGQVTGYKKDRGGEVVLSRLDESTLRRICEETGGVYYSSTLAGREIDDLYGHLSGLTESELSAGLRTQYEDRFQFFAGLAVLALLGLFLLPETGRKEAWHGRF